MAQDVLFLLHLTSNLCKIAPKMRTICTTKKSDVLCFQRLLSFVPSISHFLQFPAFHPSPAESRLLLPVVSTPRLPTTKCPQKEHIYRLSQLGGVVKEKMPNMQIPGARCQGPGADLTLLGFAALLKITARMSFPRRRESSSSGHGPPPARG